MHKFALQWLILVSTHSILCSSTSSKRYKQKNIVSSQMNHCIIWIGWQQGLIANWITTPTFAQNWNSPFPVEFICGVVSCCFLSTFYKLATTSAGDSHSFSLQMMVLLARYFLVVFEVGLCMCDLSFTVGFCCDFMFVWLFHVHMACNNLCYVVVLVWSYTVQPLFNGHPQGNA